jgi:hypothetical protein
VVRFTRAQISATAKPPVAARDWRWFSVGGLALGAGLAALGACSFDSLNPKPLPPTDDRGGAGNPSPVPGEFVDSGGAKMDAAEVVDAFTAVDARGPDAADATRDADRETGVDASSDAARDAGTD